jgi:hypothetical protein
MAFLRYGKMGKRLWITRDLTAITTKGTITSNGAYTKHIGTKALAMSLGASSTTTNSASATPPPHTMRLLHQALPGKTTVMITTIPPPHPQAPGEHADAGDMGETPVE